MPLFFLHGENQFELKQRLKNYYQGGFLKKYGENASQENLEGARTSSREILELARNTSLFAEKTQVIVWDFLRDASSDEQKKLAQNLENISADCVLIFAESASPDRRITLFKKLNKVAKVEEFKSWTPAKTAQWITQKTERSNGKIQFAVAFYLAECVNGDSFQANAETEKLLAFAQGREITRADIDELTHKNLNVSIFALTDSIGQCKLDNALRLLRDLIDNGDDPWQIFFMIVRQFRILILVRDLLDRQMNQGAITSKLKMHQFVIQKAIAQSHNFTAAQLKNIYAELLKLDCHLKTGKIQTSVDDARPLLLALEELIATACR